MHSRALGRTVDVGLPATSPDTRVMQSSLSDAKADTGAAASRIDANIAFNTNT